MTNRWIFFTTAFISILVLTTFKSNIGQVIGWSLSLTSCLAWAYFGYKDKDNPRMLMEIMYASMSVWGIVNWLK